MKITSKYLLPVCCLILFALGACSSNSYEVRVTREGSGYGYTISQAGKICIRQPFIPAINQKMPFRSADDALETAQLVVKKLCNGDDFSVSREELSELGIEFL